jgi:hypothetical protein
MPLKVATPLGLLIYLDGKHTTSRARDLTGHKLLKMPLSLNLNYIRLFLVLRRIFFTLHWALGSHHTPTTLTDISRSALYTALATTTHRSSSALPTALTLPTHCSSLALHTDPPNPTHRNSSTLCH